MFFSGSSRPAPSGAGPERETSPEEEPEGCYFVDFGAVFAEEMEKILRLRRQGMMCEIVFWQDAGYGF